MDCPRSRGGVSIGLLLLLLLRGFCALEAFTALLPTISLQGSRLMSTRVHQPWKDRKGTANTRGGTHLHTYDDDGESMTSRRHWLRNLSKVIVVPATLGAIGGLATKAEAASKTGGGAQAAREWISGKGAQPKGSDDKTGTKKETKYLRCLSNCVADCQKPTYGPERDREECLQLCQDECCTSYEQCTYPVSQNK